jgi:hypothetical protein
VSVARIHTWPRKADATTGDLAAGGMRGPTQGSPKKPKLHVYPAAKSGDLADIIEDVPELEQAPPDTAANPVQRVFRGIPVTVDRPRGFIQRGTDPAGGAWRRVYHVDYGHVPGTLGGDGDGLDVFLGGDEEAVDAHWILQRKADGTFDEYKVMLGFQDAKSAKQMYEAHVPKKFFGSMCSMSIEMMKALLGIEPIESVAKMLDGLCSILKSAGCSCAAKEEKLSPVTKPFAGFADFETCVSTMQADGKDEAAARRICGSLQADAEKTVEKRVKLTKAEQTGELRYVLGIVLAPEEVDAQGDVYSADEIRKSEWQYMTNFRNVGLMHKGLVNGKVNLVESYIAPVDMQIEGSVVKAGTWLMGLNVLDDALWKQVRSGELGGLSIGGFSKRTTV